MKKKNDVEVLIDGRKYTLCGFESPEYIQKIASYINRKLAEFHKQEGYARLDFLMKENGSMYCLEANTLPGMTPTSLLPQEAAVLGIDYAQLCERLIEISMRKYQK